MTKILIVVLCTLNFSAFGQLDELRNAQDVRLERINPNRPSNYFSKTPYVNPFIGTGGHGHTYPGATAPFGMMQLSPDTRYSGWDGCSGYHYSDSIIFGFSHTHLSGTGVSDYGDLLIVPQNGKPKIDPLYETDKGYGAKFSHEHEEASPGFYAVHLDEPNIDVRLTASERAGMHEYTFKNRKGKKFILIDLNHRDQLMSASFEIHGNKQISGTRVSSAWATEQHFNFFIELNTPFQKQRWIHKDGREKLLLIFPKSTETILLKVGISAVDVEGAKRNLEKEIPHWNFDMVRGATVGKWNRELDKIDFHSTDNEIMTNFYTGLYHSFLAPNLFNDVDGRYRGRDNQIHAVSEGNQYTVFSLWDTYRATHPLFTLTQEKRTNEFVNTFLRQYSEGGDLPVWELAGNETECMIGFHSVSVIADAYVKGIRGFDATNALAAMIATASMDEYAKDRFQIDGFIDAGKEPESVSKALEYAYDNYCIARMAQAMDQPKEVVATYDHHALNFINHFDPSTGFMRARRSGLWFSPFDPAEVNFNYTEANSWQYSLYTPHAVGVLTDLLGGPDSLEAWLDRLFTTEMELSGRHQVDITGLIGQYAHGNEPSHHMAYLYNYTNAPEKTQYYIDRILKEMYHNAPDGLSGNEDCGQMSSWYVLSALGIYQIAPGNPYYEIGRPIMNNASIHFENGKTLNISVKNNAPTAQYVQKINLNGKPIYRNYLTHEELTAGGELIMVMGENPVVSKDKFSHAPTISRVPDSFVAVPFFEQVNRVFEDSLTLTLSSIGNGGQIHYTLDGTEPTRDSPMFEQPIQIHETTTIKAVHFRNNARSQDIENLFVKSDSALSLTLKAEYANQYASSGPLALIDGVIGNEEYRTGDWQGYYAQDVEAEISFDNPRNISEVTIGCLSDMKSWIFLPSEVTVTYSYDGINFEPESITTKLDNEGEYDMPPHKKDITSSIFPKQSIKKIRIIVINFGKCPQWHLGDGNDTWLFLDEISFH